MHYLKKIKVSIGQLGLGNNTFSSIYGAFFLFQTNVATELHSINMLPRKRPEYMTLHILTEEARVEVVLLRVKMYRSCGTLTDEKFDDFIVTTA